MRRWAGGAGVAGLLVGLAGLGGTASQAATSSKEPLPAVVQDIAALKPNARFVPGEVVVKFTDGVAEESKDTALKAEKASRKQKLFLKGLDLVRVDRARGVHATAAALAKRPEVEYAEPNYLYRPAAVPNDPSYAAQWALNNADDTDINAPQAWDITTGSVNTVGAVIDTGIDYLHQDLSPNMWSNTGETASNGVDDDANGLVDDVIGWDFYSNDNSPRDANGHGTHVAGTIAAKGNNSIAVAGVAWTAKLMALRVCGAGGCPNAAIASAIAYANAKGAKFTNMSLGGPSPSAAIADAIGASPNVLHVVAAGNNGTNNDTTPQYPCNVAHPNVICVASTDQSGGLSGFSNFGETVDIGAPGGQILNAWPSLAAVGPVETFESAIGATWTSGGANNSWARTNSTASAGAFSLTDSPAGNYLNLTNSWVRQNASTSLVGRDGCHLNYDLRLQSEEGFDGILIESSLNGTTWSTQDGWSGDSGGFFFNVDSDISSHDGNATVFHRFRFLSDETITFDGAYVDNVGIRCLSSVPAAGLNTISGTSMATPHVTGAVALLLSRFPTMTAAALKQAILQSAKPVAALSSLGTNGLLNLEVALQTPCNGLLPTITGTSGVDNLIGTPGADVITGGGANDVISGLGGNDTICGGPGDDTLDGGDGNDVIEGNAGTDTVDFSAALAGVTLNMLGTPMVATGQGNDTLRFTENAIGSNQNDLLIGNQLVNVLNGGVGNDDLRGSDSNDTLIGGIGNDNLRGAGGNDNVDGGDGTDTIDVTPAPGGVTVNLLAGVSAGAHGADGIANAENFLGSAFADTFIGTGGANVASGLDGNDSLDGGPGNDQLVGGNGDDTILGGLGGDNMGGGLGVDTYDVTAAPGAVQVNIFPAGVGGTTGSFGSDTITGGIENFNLSGFNDLFIGSSAPNVVNGGAGNDELRGADANDVLNGGDGNDILRGANHSDTINGGNGVDLFDASTSLLDLVVDLEAGTSSGVGNDTMTGMEDATGGGGNDTIRGTAGPNFLRGGNGNDTLDGRSGNDTLQGEAGDDTLDGGDDTDGCAQGSGTGSIVNCET